MNISLCVSQGPAKKNTAGRQGEMKLMENFWKVRRRRENDTKARKGVGISERKPEMETSTYRASQHEDTHVRYLPAAVLEIFLTQIRNQITDL